MGKYDDLFAETATEDSVFADKRALDPLAETGDDIVARDEQERQLARLLTGVTDGYLPTTVSIYGPPGTGKTMTTRRVVTEFAKRHDEVAAEYVNLKDCRSLFSVANEIHFELTGEKLGAYEGLDGVFEGIWAALEDYPEWTVLILDEIDQIRFDSHYDSNDFFYRLLRGEGKLKRGIQLSAWMISNQLLEVDLRLDSRVESAMSDETVFFPPYGRQELQSILRPRLDRAFKTDCVDGDAVDRGVGVAANRWGDARKALRLFRRSGEVANEKGFETVTVDCIEESLQDTEREDTILKLIRLPRNHLVVLASAVGRKDANGKIIQPVRVSDIRTYLETLGLSDRFQIGERAIQQVVTDLETMGLVETWIESKNGPGRAKLLETTFEPQWALDALSEVGPDFESSHR